MCLKNRFSAFNILGKLEFLFQDCDEEVNADSNPDLGANGIVGGAVEGLDSQVLLDPLEEQLHLPAEFVEGGDAEGRKGEIVRQKDERFVGGSVEEANSSQVLWIVLPRFWQGQAPGVIAANSGLIGPCSRGVASKAEILLGPNHKVGASLMNDMQTSKVEITPVHDVKGTGLDDEGIQQVDVVALSLGDLDDGGDRTPQVQQGVQFDGALALAKVGPGKQAQAQVDGGRVEGIDCLPQLQTELLVGIQASGFDNELLRQVGVDTPVPCFVGFGQGAAGHLPAKSQRIEQLASGAQAGLDVPQALPVRQLREGHGQKLVPAREAAHPAVSSVTLDTALELFPVNPLHQLGKNRSSWVHGQRLDYASDRLGTGPRRSHENSNASHPFLVATYYTHVTYRRSLQSKPDSSVSL